MRPALQVRFAVDVAAVALYYAIDCDSGQAVIGDPLNDDSGSTSAVDSAHHRVR